ncbi:bifunctional fucokinase/L-fucose-1-P-guanylyltransferase [Faecalicatena sp. AGMB00832]|uniref:Bifunctional fucokinase/L-fucose-1-P-guanylyltransferase n=1 Tax=Faecalicatena faecalis TaxID=2726362 RepID=A0ABS6CY82_9FIRM|nr:L-fucokinase [Faecalicatena faecalis]MBU3874200.1 bifunctional fucokinase/L-fucose-1-P-guanylyltransferase [Faecalicatena faecalis]
MELTSKRMKNLFLSQSYFDAWEDYERSLKKSSFIRWDYVILTASNEEQAAMYRAQIEERLQQRRLPSTTVYEVLPDPEGKRVGSGGATFNVLAYLAQQEGKSEHHFSGKRVLVIHSGGDSKRVPQYSATGKLFSPVPRELPNGYASTLFDEFMVVMSGVPSRFREGMLVLSGDVLLLFNPLQIDFQNEGAAAISFKEHVETGKDHGVFLNDGQDFVAKFLHKQTVSMLQESGAVNAQGCVDLDTGAVILSTGLMEALYSLISTDGHLDFEKFQEFVNEKARISFYGDFLYPLAKESTLEQFYQEAAEGVICEELIQCREKLWNAIHSYSMKLLCLSPAEFIHFGTTRELLGLVTDEVSSYEFLGWKKQVMFSGVGDEEFAAHRAYVGRRANVRKNAYLEDSFILGSTDIGEGAVVSNVKLTDCRIPSNIVLHGLRLKDGKYVVRIYGVGDNPKGFYKEKDEFLGTTLSKLLEENEILSGDIWPDQDKYLWFANLYPVCDTMQEGIEQALLLYDMCRGKISRDDIEQWKLKKRMSLYSSFFLADVNYSRAWKDELENRILASKFVNMLEKGVYYKDAYQVFGSKGITESVYRELQKDAQEAEFSLRIRIFYAVSRFMKEKDLEFDGTSYDYMESQCFEGIQKEIFDNAVKKLNVGHSFKICKDRVDVKLPVRVNWGGGWTDTPPYCNEQGGVVLNAAISLNGILPVQITVKRLKDYHIEFESTDIGVFGEVHTVQEVQDCHNPYDSFALHKAALIACGIVPLYGNASLEEILKKIGGGIYLSTQVIGIPKGSGLGTSSILSGACVKGIFEFLGHDISDDEIYGIVLSMEQIMSTGGGWQDQVGGLTNGVKFITTEPGIDQEIHVEKVLLSDSVKEELQERFAVIYTGQRRLARNLLRDVVGSYIGARPESIEALKEMQPLAALMKFALERGNVDEFARLLNQHWELSKQLDQGSSNTCIEQIFLSCADLISGRFIAGAGGGGFLMVVLKRGITKTQLKERLHEIFQDSGVDVWESAFIWE